jgi:Glyoxalase/Bleomycin resistance protein/Dioxygenase superfamily
MADVAEPIDLDGVAVTPGPPPAPGPGHPNTAVAVDHVVVTTPDLDRTVAALGEVGVAIKRSRDVPGGERRQAFVRLGEAVLELVGPVVPADDQRPAAVWGWVATVADADAASRACGDLLGEWREAVQPGRRIATVSSAAHLAVPFAMMTP